MTSVDSTESSPKISEAHLTNTQEKSALKEYAREDVYIHNKPTDAWLLIDPYIYDVTEYNDHPGGRSVLN